MTQFFLDIAAKSFSKQRGLARFPSSCLLHPADAMAMYSCLTCCGISSMSFGSLMNDRKKGPPPQVGMYSRKEHLLHELRKRDVKLVTPQVFFDFWKRQEPLPRCQDVPREYFLNIDKISEAQAEKLEVVAVSYCWIDSSHPDPQCYHLRTLCGLLEKFCHWDVHCHQDLHLHGQDVRCKRERGPWQWRWPTRGLVSRLDERATGAPQRCRRQGLRARPSQHQSVGTPILPQQLGCSRRCRQESRAPTMETAAGPPSSGRLLVSSLPQRSFWRSAPTCGTSCLQVASGATTTTRSV